MRSIPTGTANGNQLSDPAGVLTSGYDVENRLTWGTKSSASVANGYGYDPDNRRVYLSKWLWNAGAREWRLTGGGYEEVIYYGVSGQKMGTYRLTADASGLYLAAVGYNVYFGSKLVRKVAADGTAQIVRSDRLGSFGRFYAYGQERGTPPPENTEKFATYYRDADTGLDYAVNRYYSSGWGRFLTPDPWSGSSVATDPGSWNRYSYTRGDPTNRTDSSGLSDCGAPDALNGVMCVAADPAANNFVLDNAVCVVDGAPLGCGAANALYAAGVALTLPEYEKWWFSVSSPPVTPLSILDDQGYVVKYNPKNPQEYVKAMLVALGLWDLIDQNTITVDGNGIHFHWLNGTGSEVLPILDQYFIAGPLGYEHKGTVGSVFVDYRTSTLNGLSTRSLQIVWGNLDIVYADTDRWSPYDSGPVGFLLHAIDYSCGKLGGCRGR